MFYWIILFASIAAYCVIYGQEQMCEIALRGVQGQCKSIFKCQPLLSIVYKTNKTLQDKSLLKTSHCGIDDDAPAVCCHEPNGLQCFTPEGNKGQCINIHSCPRLLNLLNPPVSSAVLQFVNNSRCASSNQYSVCCGPVPNFAPETKGKCNLSAFPPDPMTECCGIDSKYQNKIYGGNKTTIYEYPWLTMLEYVKDTELKVYGSGALISGLYVLTAAATVGLETVGKPVNVRLGEYDTSVEGPDCIEVEGGSEDCTDGTIRIPIEKFIPHPQFDLQQKKNNIALIRMSQMAPYTEFIRPICLPTTDVTQRTDIVDLLAAGWESNRYIQDQNNIKFHVYLPYVNWEVCQKMHTKRGLTESLGEGQFCAGDENGKDSCRSDHVLMYKRGIRFEYTGILSFGTRICGQTGIRTVYTNVFTYISWIRSTIES